LSELHHKYVYEQTASETQATHADSMAASSGNVTAITDDAEQHRSPSSLACVCFGVLPPFWQIYPNVQYCKICWSTQWYSGKTTGSQLLWTAMTNIWAVMYCTLLFLILAKSFQDSSQRTQTCTDEACHH